MQKLRIWEAGDRSPTAQKYAKAGVQACKKKKAVQCKGKNGSMRAAGAEVLHGRN